MLTTIANIDLRIFAWNNRTLHRTGASIQQADALDTCKADIPNSYPRNMMKRA